MDRSGILGQDHINVTGRKPDFVPAESMVSAFDFSVHSYLSMMTGLQSRDPRQPQREK